MKELATRLKQSLHNFSGGKVSHIPISCVTRENVDGSEVTGICCSRNGIVYLSDIGCNKVYRVDSSSGSCMSFGGDIILGEYLMVLDQQFLAIFTPMGILIKKCSIDLKCRPVSLNISGKILVLTR